MSEHFPNRVEVMQARITELEAEVKRLKACIIKEAAYIACQRFEIENEIIENRFLESSMRLKKAALEGKDG